MGGGVGKYVGIKVWGRCGKVLGQESFGGGMEKGVEVWVGKGRCGEKCRGCGEVCWGVGGGVGKCRGRFGGVGCWDVGGDVEKCWGGVGAV